ncbi:hypothetical protein IP87_15645 [beta proteobacterium AAP121]|nr:hypothetical protein IP80_15005 [beta proteobacterium AAP65]KPF95811.1 hypothetical protein IP87_15645 [beta proteobacterium AAP121]
MDFSIATAPAAALPVTMTRTPNAVVLCQAAQFRESFADFAPQLGRSTQRIEAEIAVARQAGHKFMVYRVALPMQDVPPSLVLGTIDPDGPGVVVLRPETVPDLGIGWTAYVGSARRSFPDMRSAEQFLAKNPPRHERDEWKPFALYIAP